MLKLIQRRRRTLGLALLTAVAALLLGCSQSNLQSTFDAQGPVAESQLKLFWVIFGTGAFVFVVVEAALIYAMLKFRRRRDDEIPVQTHGNTTLEIAWTAAPAFLLILVAIPTVFTIFSNANSPDPVDQGGLVVDVIGHQWWFEFRYPHPDNAGQDVVFANELHIPVGETVNLRLDSDDVIHSFWVPKLAGKVDMVPRNDNTMWIRADRSGLFYGQCAEFCGVAHAHMRFHVVAESRAEFDAWLLEQAAPAVESPDPLIKQGKNVFLRNCTLCHDNKSIIQRGPDGELTRNKGGYEFAGPNLTHVASRGLLAAGVFDNRDESGLVSPFLVQKNLRTWLEDPGKAKPGNIMATQADVFTDPEKRLSDADLSALVAYLSSLK